MHEVIDKLLRKLRLRDDISPEEEAALAELPGQILQVPAHRTVIRAGELLNQSTLLIEGLMCRYRDLRDGGRQISELHVAGDFLDLHGFSLKRLDHAIMALTPCRIANVPHDRLIRLTETHPHLTRLLWFSTNLDAAIHREWMVSIGRRGALERVAHLLCELRVRFLTVGLADEAGYALPLTQTDLAECLGLTSVHVNRVLRELRERGLATFRRKEVAIHNLPGLERLAEFDPVYLSLEHRPR